MADSKKKKSKLEKIYELQASVKGLKEENRTLRKQIQSFKDKDPGSAAMLDERSMGSSNNEEKLLEAMKALKRVTVKQEMSLNTIRSKAEKRRLQMAQKDEQVKELQQELKSMKQAQRARKEADSNTDLSALRTKVEDLELRCSEQENKNKMLTLQLETSEETTKNLQKQLQSARGLMDRPASNRSLKSADTSASEFDLARMRKELAAKIERIVLLEFDLEMCRDELHELKQRNGNSGDYSGGGQHDGGAGADDYFSEDDDDDDLWT